MKRLGYYDHTQRQLGDRVLYVFPSKGDATRITCEGPEGAPVHPEDPVCRRVRMGGLSGPSVSRGSRVTSLKVKSLKLCFIFLLFFV